MELSKSDVHLVLRTAYKTGLLQKLTAKTIQPEVHIPGTSIVDDPATGQVLDFPMTEAYFEFLAELIAEVRKEGKTDDR